MSKKKPKTASAFPIRSSAQVKEDNSRVIFESSIPWMISSWIQRDFGIDATVEITKQISKSKDQIVTGKRFSVQLKSSDQKNFSGSSISISIPREKITYWFNAIEPVLLVLLDLNEKKSYYKWIDQHLIDLLFKQNESWIAQESITLHFNKEDYISNETLTKIEKYVLFWKRPAKTILTPGNYFHYSHQIKNYVDSLVSNIQENRIMFLQKDIAELQKQVNQPIYTIAIVGPSRSGKSTLINALLHKEVSPVGILPTTGIPITIFPKNENKTIIVFKDGSEIGGQTQKSFIEEYTSQDKNPLNEKNVKLVSVYIINTLLEKGFALCDVPGLDDPDEEIRAISKTAAYNVNAIIYVVNAGPMRDGGFSITKQIIDDLNELAGKVDKLFLVFNKIDLLNPELLVQLKQYVTSSLDRFNILQYLPAPPFYISSYDSFKNRVNGNRNPDSVADLENQIWSFLLSENKTGVNKLLGSYSDCKDLLEKLRRIIGTTLLNSEMRKKVEQEIMEVKSEMGQLKTIVANKRERIIQNLNEFLINSFENILTFLRKELESVPLQSPLHDSSVISTWLENNAFNKISVVYNHLQEEVRVMQSEINYWIAQKLKQVEINLEAEQGYSEFKIPDITHYTSQINLFFREDNDAHPGVLETVVISVAAFVAEILKIFDTLFTSNEKIRQRQINNILRRAKNGYDKISRNCISHLTTYLGNISNAIESKSHDRANVYLGELSSQLAKFDIEVSQREKRRFEQFLQNASEIEREINSDFLHLKEYSEGIEKSKYL